MLVRTHARNLLSFGLALGLAAACGDDNSGGDDDDDDPTTTVTTATTVVPTGTVTSAAIGVATATSGSPSNQTSTSSTTGAGGTGGLGGAAGSGGAGEECDPDPNSGLPTSSEGGAAGAAGAASVSYDDGFHFTDPASVASWRLKPVADCPECIPDATLEAGCGSLVMTANWPEEANTGPLKSTAELNAAGDERWDLSGRTVTVRARWLSGGDTANNGFNVYLELLDENYSFYGPTLGEVYDAGEAYAEWSVVVPSAPEGEFDPATVRQINVRFDTKFWTDEEAPPTFAYETSIFEIDAVVW